MEPAISSDMRVLKCFGRVKVPGDANTTEGQV